jgi:hypothetical protein
MVELWLPMFWHWSSLIDGWCIWCIWSIERISPLLNKPMSGAISLLSACALEAVIVVQICFQSLCNWTNANSIQRSCANVPCGNSLTHIQYCHVALAFYMVQKSRRDIGLIPLCCIASGDIRPPFFAILQESPTKTRRCCTEGLGPTPEFYLCVVPARHIC